MGKIILASASPRRKELLEKAGVSFEVLPSCGEEHITRKEPDEIVKELALAKARSVAHEMKEGTVVIGADTIVFHKGRILGKPASPADSVRTLMELQGDTHQVYTGVAVLVRREDGWQTLNFAERTDVTFYPVSREAVLSYVETGEPADKAGSYAIQGPFGFYVKEIRGDYFNVVGLPVPRLLYETARAGIFLRQEERQKEEKGTEYDQSLYF